jgi:AcrR family transcriptional regulator
MSNRPIPVTKTDLKKQTLIDTLADHLLANGLQAASLRTLASAANTSDRMLLHYFVNKEALMSAVLNVLSSRLIQLLDSARTEPLPMPQLLRFLTGMISTPAVRPYLSLWLQLAALSTHEPHYQRNAQQIGEHFLAWISAALQVKDDSKRPKIAALALATIEGFVLLNALGFDEQIAGALEALEQD